MDTWEITYVPWENYMGAYTDADKMLVSVLAESAINAILRFSNDGKIVKLEMKYG